MLLEGFVCIGCERGLFIVVVHICKKHMDIFVVFLLSNRDYTSRYFTSPTTLVDLPFSTPECLVKTSAAPSSREAHSSARSMTRRDSCLVLQIPFRTLHMLRHPHGSAALSHPGSTSETAEEPENIFHSRFRTISHEESHRMWDERASFPGSDKTNGGQGRQHGTSSSLPMRDFVQVLDSTAPHY